MRLRGIARGRLRRRRRNSSTILPGASRAVQGAEKVHFRRAAENLDRQDPEIHPARKGQIRGSDQVGSCRHDPLSRARPRHALHPAHRGRPRRGRGAARQRGGLRRSDRTDFRGSRQIRRRRAGAAEPTRRQGRLPVQGRRGDHAGRGEIRLRRLLRQWLARHAGGGRMGRAGAAATGQHARSGNVDGGQPRVLAVPDAHHGRDFGNRASRFARPEGALPAENGRRRMDGHHEPDGAAGGLRSRRRAYKSGSRRRRLPHHRHEDFHHLGRARRRREHHPSRAGAPA